jgi:D-amino peptidase
MLDFLFGKENPKPQIKPNIWLYVDMEGINNISSWNEVNPSCKEYAKGIEKFTREVNSVTKGFFDGGANSVKVNDLHWFYNNLIAKKLDKRVQIAKGANLNIDGFFKEEFDAVAIVGMHAMNNTENAVLCHTWYLPSYIESVKHDGKFIGEIGMIKFLADEKGVPVIFISGDKAGCDEAKTVLPNIHTAVTKEKRKNNVKFLSEGASNRLVHSVGKESIRHFITNYKKPTKKALEERIKITDKPIEVTFATAKLAEVIENRCKFKRVRHFRNDARIVEFRGKKFSEILQNFFSVLD